jgi:hypothetical protein
MTDLSPRPLPGCLAACDDRAPEGQRAPSRASPSSSCPPSNPFLPRIKNISSSKPPQEALSQRIFGGLQGGCTQPPCICGISSKRNTPTVRSSTNRSTSQAPYV